MMKPFSKPSAASAISSEDKLFLRARLKLTAIYTLFVSVILSALSALLYYELVINVTDSFGDQLSAGSPQEHALHDTLEKLRTSIVLTDAVIILIVAACSYFFAMRTLSPIRRSLEAQKRFAADASHELRTPLTVMKTELEVALRDTSLKTADMRSVFRSTLEEVEHMSALTEQLLFLSRANTPAGTDPATVDLSALTERVLGKMTALADAKNLAVECSIEPGVRIAGHAHDLERVLYNLLQNAITYTERGCVRVRLTRTSQETLLKVEDTGAGIAAKHLPHVFDRFYKADTARDARKGGAGLGLSIVKEIVENHGGSIGAASEHGKGATFSVRFPGA
jgi:signal transduction histidine kinase